MSRPVSSRRASPSGAGGPAGRAASVAVKRHSRAERAKQIERLARRGLGTAEIAAQLGLARSTVNIYRRDPDGSRHRQRLERYRGQCDGCGRLTSGSGGRARAPARCRRCAGAQRRLWPSEPILQRIKDWTDETVAERYGVSVSWVYANKHRFGSLMLGNGPKARLPSITNANQPSTAALR